MPRTRSVLRRWKALFRLVAAVCLFAAGIVARDVHQGWGARFLTHVPPLEHFLWWHSFSEVEQTRALLQGLSLRSIAETRAAIFRAQHGAKPLTSSVADGVQRARADAVDRLRQLVPEFEGTEQAVVLRAELLRHFHLSGAISDWLDTYLEVVYLAPTHALLGDIETRAAEYGRTLGRETEVDAALAHRRSVPTRYWNRPPFGGNPSLADTAFALPQPEAR